MSVWVQEPSNNDSIDCARKMSGRSFKDVGSIPASPLGRDPQALLGDPFRDLPFVEGGEHAGQTQTPLLPPWLSRFHF